MKKLFTLLLITLSLAGAHAQHRQALPLCGNLAAPIITGTSVSVTSGTTANVTVDWANNGGTTYELWYKLDFETAYTKAAGAAPVLSCTAVGLQLRNRYVFQVRSYRFCALKNGEPESEVKTSEVTVSLPPPAPTGLVIGASTDTSFEAGWTFVSTVSYYYIDVSTSPAFDTFVMNNVKISKNTTTVSNLTPGTAYYYRVRAVEGSGTSPNSATCTFLPQLPSAPLGITASPLYLGDSFVLEWGLAQRAKHYKLEVSTTPGYINPMVIITDTQRSIKITTVTPGINYYARVSAFNDAGYSSYAATVYIQPPPPPTILPITNFTPDGFTVNWQPNGWAIQYWVDVSANENFSTLIYDGLSAGNGTSLAIHGLAAGGTYYVRVRAGNESAFKSAYSGTQSGSITPAVPVSLPITDRTTDGFTVNWQPSAGATHYWIDVASEPSFYTLYKSNVDAGNATALPVTGLGPWTRYYVRVRASNNAPDKSPYSETQSSELFPEAPDDLNTRRLSAHSITVNFSTGAFNQFFDAATDPGFTSLIYNNAPATDNNFANLDNLQPTTTYYVRVRSVNSYGDVSPNSQTAIVQTLPLPPADLLVTNLTPTSFTASWQPVPGATHYSLEVAKLFPDFTPDYSGYTKYDAGSSTSVTAMNLVPGSYYYLRVFATELNTYSGIQYTETPASLNAIQALAQYPEDELFSIYPNPSRGQFSVALHLPESASGEQAEIRVLNAAGETVSIVKPQPGAQTDAVDLGNQPLGIYQVQLRYQNRVIRKKIVKL